MLHVKTLLTVEMNLLLETYQKWYLCYHLPCNIFINAFAFLNVNANSKEICEEMFFSSFFQKNAYVGIFVEI